MIDDVAVSAYMRPCNWMQALEGDIDTVHTLYLHLGLTQYEDAPVGSWAWWHLQNRAPHYAAIDTDFGTMYGAYRPAMEGINYWRFANFLMPFYAMTPPGVLGLEHKFRAWVPMDDTHTLAISSNQRSPLLGPNGERPKGKWASGATDVYPNGTGFFDRFRCVADMDNDFGVDREAQKTKSFAGLKSIFLEDQAVTVSMGSCRRPREGAARHQRPDDYPFAPAPAAGRPLIARGRNTARRRQPGGVRRAVRRRHAAHRL